MATIPDKKEKGPSPENVLEMSTVILLEGTFPSISPASDDSPRIYTIERHFNDRTLDILGLTYGVPNIDFGTRPNILDPQTGNLTMSDIFAGNIKIKEALKDLLPNEVWVRLHPAGRLCFHSYRSYEEANFSFEPQGLNSHNPGDYWVPHIERLHDFYRRRKETSRFGLGPGPA